MGKTAKEKAKKREASKGMSNDQQVSSKNFSPPIKSLQHLSKLQIFLQIHRLNKALQKHYQRSKNPPAPLILKKAILMIPIQTVKQMKNQAVGREKIPILKNRILLRKVLLATISIGMMQI